MLKDEEELYRLKVSANVDNYTFQLDNTTNIVQSLSRAFLAYVWHDIYRAHENKLRKLCY